MTRILAFAAAIACAASLSNAQSVPTNTTVSGGTGSEVAVGQAGSLALLGGTVTATTIVVAVVAVGLVAAVAAEDDSSSTTTTTGSN